MARPADPAYAALKVKPLLRKQNWTYKSILLLFFLIMSMVALVVSVTTPGWIFFKYMNRRTFYGIWYLLVCDEYVTQWTWEHWWEYTTTIAYSECRHRFFPELGLRESFMLISDSVQSDQFSYLNSNDWLIAVEALTTFSLFLYITAFIIIIVGMAKRTFSPVKVDFIFYFSVGIAAASIATSAALYMYKMFERCAFSTGANCWIGYAFYLAVVSVAFALIAIFIRLCERRGICCKGDVLDESTFATRMDPIGEMDPFPQYPGASGSKLAINGTPPPGYPMGTLSSKTVCTQL